MYKKTLKYLSHLQPEWYFAAIFVFAGLLFAIIVPPFENADEPAHFYRSYEISKGHILPGRAGDQLYGGFIPNTMKKLVEQSDIANNFDPAHKFDVNYHQLLSLRYGSGSQSYEIFPNSSLYSPVAYIPSVLAQWMIGIFHGPMILTLYLARILSVVAAAGIIFFAIRIIPFGKWVMFAVGLLPMAIASSASVSADAMTISLSLLLISLTLKIAFSKKVVSNRWFIGLLVVCVLVGLVKQAHAALLPIVLLIPLLNKMYRTKRTYFIIAGIAALSAIAFLAWYLVVRKIEISADPLIQPDAQRSYILGHPIDYLVILWKTFFTNYSDGFMVGLFGNFGWLTAPLPILYIVVSSMALLASTQVRADDELKDVKPRQVLTMRITMLVVALLAVVLISTALYMYWTPVRNIVVVGLQGRYFIAIAPLLLLSGILWNKKRSETKPTFVVIASVVVVIASLFIMHSRFYS